MNNTKETLSNVRDVIPDIGGDFQLDQAVIEGLTRIHGIPTQAFDKVFQCATETGDLMTMGEFHSISEIYKLAPTLTPRPVAWGKFRDATVDTYFFLCDFVDMSSKLPDPVNFCARIAQLHRESNSPTGKFGFHVKNCKGKTPQPTEWEASWTRYFTRLLSYGFEEDLISNGPWPEYEQAFSLLVKDAIPQILDPLTEEGRTIKPCLVHGDLWEGNTTTNLDTGEPMIFDAAAFYAHNEYELGIWRRDMVKFGHPYFFHYFRNFPISEPADQFHDRNALYCLKFDLDYCLHRPGMPLVREQFVLQTRPTRRLLFTSLTQNRILADILALVNKYPPRRQCQ